MEPVVRISLVMDGTELAVLVVVSVAALYVTLAISLFVVELTIRPGTRKKNF